MHVFNLKMILIINIQGEIDFLMFDQEHAKQKTLSCFIITSL